MKERNEKGFTLIELIIVVAILFIVVAVIGYGIIGTVIIMGNFWYEETGVLHELKIDHPQVSHIVRTQRNVWRHSVVEVEENGQRKLYFLDTNILWNYRFHEQQ